MQGAFVTDKEVSDVVEYIIEKNGQVAYNAEVEEKVNTSENSIGNGSGFTNSADDRDAYFADAGKFIIEKEKEMCIRDSCMEIWRPGIGQYLL